MSDPVKTMRESVGRLVKTLNPDDIFLAETTRDLTAIVDSKFAVQVGARRWYAQITRGEHMYAVTDIRGKRISLQRFVLLLENPDKTLDEIKHVSFENKISFDCRLSNLEYRVGRQSVMRNRRPKRNTSSQYKGVRKKTRNDGTIFWQGQIRGDFGTMSLGPYEDEKEAALVYDAAAYLLFKGAGFYNFPELCPDKDALEMAYVRIERFKNWQRRKEEQDAQKDSR